MSHATSTATATAPVADAAADKFNNWKHYTVAAVVVVMAAAAAVETGVELRLNFLASQCAHAYVCVDNSWVGWHVLQQQQ